MKKEIDRFLFPGIGGATGAAAVSAVLNPPVMATAQLSQSAAGALAAQTYFVKTTFVNANGETLPSNEVSLAVLINNVLNVAPPVNAPATATGWNVYVSNTTGTETKQNGGTPIALGVAWVEPNTGLVAGSALPGANTAVFGLVAGSLRQQVLITVTQNTWVDIRPSAKASSGAALLVTPSTPIETVICPGDSISYIQDTAAGQISIVQIAG